VQGKRRLRLGTLTSHLSSFVKLFEYLGRTTKHADNRQVLDNYAGAFRSLRNRASNQYTKIRAQTNLDTSRYACMRGPNSMIIMVRTWPHAQLRRICPWWHLVTLTPLPSVVDPGRRAR
jgi:hypothetical protein